MKKLSVVSWLLMLLVIGPGCSDDSQNKGSGDGGGGSDQTVAGSLSMDQLISGCLRTSACGIKTYPYLGNCIDAYMDLYRAQGLAPIWDKIYTCVNAAKGDCDAVYKCFRRGGACDKDSKASCDGTVANSCDLIDQRLYGMDCAHAGLKCAVPSGNQSSAACTPGTCDSSTYKSKCDGTKLYTCSYGVIETTECAVTGMGCALYGWKDKTYACQGSSPDTCRNYGKWTFKTFCEGSKAVTCQHGKEHREDCSKRTYRRTKCNGGSCVAAGAVCTSNMNRCNGDKLESCLDGKWVGFDCTALGLGACKPGKTVGANCARPSI